VCTFKVKEYLFYIVRRLFKGKLLQDGDLLKDKGIQDGNVLHSTVLLRGGFKLL